MLLGHIYLEGLALEEFTLLIDAFEGLFIAQIYTHVRMDEARHVAGGLKYLAARIARAPALSEHLKRHLIENLPVLAVGESGVSHLARVSGREPDVIRRRMEKRTEFFLDRLTAG